MTVGDSLVKLSTGSSTGEIIRLETGMALLWDCLDGVEGGNRCVLLGQERIATSAIETDEACRDGGILSAMIATAK